METKIKEILPKDVKNRLEKGEKLSVIDVREPQEVEEGEIHGAKHIPLGEVLTRLNEIDKDQEHIIVCRSGNRSELASEWLMDKGFKVKNMSGGMTKWSEDV